MDSYLGCPTVRKFPYDVNRADPLLPVLSGGPYARHRPEDTVLYAVVEEYIEAFFARLGEQAVS
jgi:hypothetical protein